MLINFALTGYMDQEKALKLKMTPFLMAKVLHFVDFIKSRHNKENFWWLKELEK